MNTTEFLAKVDEYLRQGYSRIYIASVLVGRMESFPDGFPSWKLGELERIAMCTGWSEYDRYWLHAPTGVKVFKASGFTQSQREYYNSVRERRKAILACPIGHNQFGFFMLNWAEQGGTLAVNERSELCIVQDGTVNGRLTDVFCQTKNHSFDVTTVLAKPDPKSTFTHYGVELEVSTSYPNRPLLEAFNSQFAQLKQDSSVSGCMSNNVEIVTKPATLREHRQAWASFFKKLDVNKFDNGYDSTNGLHVHIDRRAFKMLTIEGEPINKLHMAKFLRFLSSPENKGGVWLLSERSDSDDRWCQWRTTTKLSKATREYPSEKYSVVNISKSATLEVRVFKGVPTYTSVMKALEFCDALVKYTSVASFNKLDFNSFKQWVDRKAYPVLWECLQQMPEQMTIRKDRYGEVRNLKRTSLTVFMQQFNDLKLDHEDMTSEMNFELSCTIRDTFNGQLSLRLKDNYWVLVPKHRWKMRSIDDQILAKRKVA